MPIHTHFIVQHTQGKGLYEVTQEVSAKLKESRLREGTVTLFCQHTSCSLVIMENADPSVCQDLERFFEHLVPTSYPHFTHTLEGPDDMPSHIKMALTRTSESIPFYKGCLCLGTWQGIFLWEHRKAPHTRHIVVQFRG